MVGIYIEVALYIHWPDRGNLIILFSLLKELRRLSGCHVTVCSINEEICMYVCVNVNLSEV